MKSLQLFALTFITFSLAFAVWGRGGNSYDSEVMMSSKTVSGDKIKNHYQQMQQTMNQLKNAKTEEERKELMSKHFSQMEEHMEMMRSMMQSRGVAGQQGQGMGHMMDSNSGSMGMHMGNMHQMMGGMLDQMRMHQQSCK